MTFVLFYFRGLKSALIFDGIEEALEKDGANLVKKVKGIFGFKVKDTNGKDHLWIVDAKNGNGKVEFNGKGTQLHTYVYFRCGHVVRDFESEAKTS